MAKYILCILIYLSTAIFHHKIHVRNEMESQEKKIPWKYRTWRYNISKKKTNKFLLWTVTVNSQRKYSHQHFSCRKFEICISFYGPDAKTHCHSTRCHWTTPGKLWKKLQNVRFSETSYVRTHAYIIILIFQQKMFQILLDRTEPYRTRKNWRNQFLPGIPDIISFSEGHFYPRMTPVFFSGYDTSWVWFPFF